MNTTDYRTGPLSYGVTTFIGGLAIGKLRVSVELFNELELFLKKNNINYSRLLQSKKQDKKGVTKEYVHFSYAMTPQNLNKVKVIIRKRRIMKINEEIIQLETWLR